MSEKAEQAVMKRDLVIRRIVDAPVEMVWKAWTEPDQVMRWWGPEYWTSPSCKIDLREGGKLIFCMQAPPEQGGQRQYTSGAYKKIVPMKYLEFTQGLSDEEGNPVPPESLGMPPDFPAVIRTSVEFRPKGSMTELIITEYDWPMSQMMVYSYAGMHQCMDKLEEAFGRK